MFLSSWASSRSVRSLRNINCIIIVITLDGTDRNIYRTMVLSSLLMSWRSFSMWRMWRETSVCQLFSTRRISWRWAWLRVFLWSERNNSTADCLAYREEWGGSSLESESDSLMSLMGGRRWPREVSVWGTASRGTELSGSFWTNTMWWFCKKYSRQSCILRCWSMVGEWLEGFQNQPSEWNAGGLSAKCFDLCVNSGATCYLCVPRLFLKISV